MEKVVTSVLTLAPRVSVQKVEDRSRWVLPASKVKGRSGQGVMWSGCGVVRAWCGQGVAWSRFGVVKVSCGVVKVCGGILRYCGVKVWWGSWCGGVQGVVEVKVWWGSWCGGFKGVVGVEVCCGLVWCSEVKAGCCHRVMWCEVAQLEPVWPSSYQSSASDHLRSSAI